MRNLLAELLNKSSKKQKKISQSQWVVILDIVGYIGCIALILYVAYRWGTAFFDPYLQNDDARIYLFPYWGFHSDLFKEDYLAHIMSAYTPWLHKSFYYLLTFKFDLLTVTKIVQILAIAWGCFHLFRIGHRRAGVLGGLFALYLGLHTFVLLYRAGGGLQRAFRLPILLMTVDGIDRNSERQSALGAILGFTIYPPAGMIALTTHCIWIVTQSIISKSDWMTLRKVFVKVGVVILLCFLSVSPLLLSSSKFGKSYSLQQARLMPEFGVNGRANVVPLPKADTVIFKNLKKLTSTSGDSPLPSLELFTRESGGTPLYLFICFALLLTVVNLTRPPYVSLYIATAGIFLFGLVSLLAFRLYVPQRMISIALPAAVLYLLSSTYTEIGYNSFKSIVPRLSSLITTLVFIAFFGIAFKGPIGLTVNAHSEKELFQLLQTLPENALFSGHPMRTNNIPLWAKRRILISYETSQPWFDKTWEKLKERNYDNLEAYYASDPGPLFTLREKYGVDYMLVHEADISPSYARHCQYFEPFTKRLKSLCQKPSEELIWRKATPLSIVGRASGFYVIDLDTFLEQLTTH